MDINKMMSILRVIFCSSILMTMTICPLTKADFGQDKKECQNQLLRLRTCLGFIGGEEKNPSPSCCLVLMQNFNQSRRCMCILVRDRNEPSLGFKVNATLALSLPFLCHVPANESHCLDLLKIDPRSPEAQIFLQFANSTAKGTTTTAAGGDAPSGSSTHERQRIQFLVVGGVSAWFLVSSFFL